ncbi:MAG: hypothetical protein ABMA64_03770 [Myxococcota bacterium]
MKNLWIQLEPPFVTWTAHLDAARGAPERLLAVVEQVLAAGAEHQVFDVVEARAIGFVPPAPDVAALRARLREAYDRDRVVDLFGFTDAAMKPRATPHASAVRAKVAWFAPDTPTEAWTEDLGAVLRALEPVPGSIPNGMTTPYPPVRITGWRYPTDAAGVVTTGARRVRFHVALHSDIWFPWVFGSAHPECDHLRMFDNRPLAELHTPRLGRFLGAAAAAVRAAGGTWEVDLDATGPWVVDWLGDASIDLARPPAFVMPARALSVPWY